MSKIELTEQEVKILNGKKAMTSLLMNKDPLNYRKAIRYRKYSNKLKKLQVELIKLHEHIIAQKLRVVVIFEGRDAAGKGGAIRRITERINPRFFRIVALPKPTEEEQTQWYFRRYVNKFPSAGQIVFFDRSWYNRAIVEPVNGFCSEKDYEIFMNQVNEFERMITESGIILVKIYMSISKNEQARRFDDIKTNPLKQWKYSDVDAKAQELWDQYTEYKNKMFENTKSGIPFKVIRGNRKENARIKVIEYLLKTIPYDKDRVV